jgi:ABC-2 type transport system ATP-binding protein
MSTALRVDGLHVSYRAKNGKKVEAVKGLSFEVMPGEVVGFLGPNGAGKSSTLKAIMGFVEPDQGTCEVFGEASWLESSRRNMGYLPEVAMYYPYLTPRETLRLYGELQGLGGKALKAESEELLTQVGLANAMDKQNRQLSKGMLQRVGIAQSLLGNPKLLVLDEVTSGIDPVGRKELRNLLKAKQREGTTLFFSSHELAEVEMLCDRILLIHEGLLIEERQVSLLKEDLRIHAVTYAGDTDLTSIATRIELGPDATLIASFERKGDLLIALDLIQKSGGTVLDIVAQEGSLEDYFIETIAEAA